MVLMRGGVNRDIEWVIEFGVVPTELSDNN